MPPREAADGPDRRTLGAGLVAALLAAAGGAGQGRAGVPVAEDWSRMWPPKEVIPLWPDSPPGRIDGFVVPDLPEGWSGGAWPAHFLRRIAMPTLNVFRPDKPNGDALLVCPGGSYVFVSAHNEGVEVARLFAARGVTIFVLAYRLPGEGWRDRADVPLQDAQRAMRLIRSRAAAYGIRPERIGVLGFSAGGHVAASLAVGHGEQVYRPVDRVDAESARPAYAGLVYPVILIEGASAHARSRAELLGPAPAPEVAARRAPNLHVSASTPPCFVAHASDDGSVPIENGLQMVAALRAAKVPSEAHFFAEGQHAFGIGRPGQPSEMWPDLFVRWANRLAEAA